MAQTTPRESLTCVAISYVAKEGNRSNIDQFSQAVEKYYFENDSNGINSFKDNLPSDFNFNRIKELFKSEIEARKPGKDYPKNIYEKDFPNGKEYKSEVDGPTKLDVEIKSAFSTAEVLQRTPIVPSLSSYVIHDQSSDVMKTIKDDALNKTVRALDLPKDVGSDILSSIDLILIKRSRESAILNDFQENIVGNNVKNIDILNNLAYGTTGKNTFRTLTNKYFKNKELVGVSLKKVPAKRDAEIKIIGTIAGAKDLELYLDPYTEFLGKVSSTKSRVELFKLIDKLVEIDKIMPTEPRAYFSVNFKLNYKDVDISDKIVKLNLQIGRSGFNAAESGKGGFVGGTSYSIGLPILKKYPRYNQMVREVISIREKAFKFAIKQKVPNNLKNEYSKALSMVRKNVLVLYDIKDNLIIKEFCNKYDNEVGNQQDSYQQYRIGVSKLCKNKSLQSSNGSLMDLDKESAKVTGVPKTLQNDYVHAQGLWMYTRENENLKRFFKQQISLTLYGLMSKKGAKVFYSKGKEMITESAFVKEFKDSNNKSKLAKVASAPFILID